MPLTPNFLPFLVMLALATASGANAQVPQAWESVIANPGNVDSIAVYHPGDPAEAVVFLTSKENDTVEVFDAASGAHLSTIGQSGTALGDLERPNGVAVVHGVGPAHQDILLVVERDNDRVQLFALPGYAPISTFGQTELANPYGCAVSMEDDAVMVYVTDQSGADGERVRKYRLDDVAGTITGTLVLSFGPSTGTHALVTVESIVTDDATDRVFVCDETADDIKVFDADGNYQTTLSGPGTAPGLFEGEPEGIVIYRQGESGVIIVSDQRLVDSRFNLYDLDTLAPIGTFTTVPAIARTDGIALTQRPLPPYDNGLFYAVHDDVSMRAYDLDDVMGLFGLPIEAEHLARDREAISAAAGGRCEFILPLGPAHAMRPYLLVVSASGSTPGYPLGGGSVLPLNPDSLTADSITFGDNPPQFGFLGTLGTAGQASAALDVPAGFIPPTGLTFDLHLAALLYDLPLTPTNAVRLTILP